MARRGKNEVVLTFAGDSDQLEKAFDRVGASAQDMAGDVDKASGKVKRSAAEGFDRVGEAADNVDTRAMGFRDTITGVQDTMRGLNDESLSLGDRLLTLGMGVGDLASGMFSFLIPSLKAGVLWLGNTTIAQRALNLAMRLNPIGLIITGLALLGAGLVLAWKNSETFRRIVTGAFNAVRGAAVAAFDWVKRNWPLLLGIITGPFGLAVVAVVKNWDKIKNGASAVVDAVKGFFSGLGSSISAPFTAAFGVIKRAWNSTVGGFGVDIPGFLGFGGASFRIPRMHTGGIVPGAPGTEALAILAAGERVTPAGRGGGSFSLTISSGGSALDDLLVELIRLAVRRQGGNVQDALGGTTA